MKAIFSAFMRRKAPRPAASAQTNNNGVNTNDADVEIPPVVGTSESPYISVFVEAGDRKRCNEQSQREVEGMTFARDNAAATDEQGHCQSNDNTETEFEVDQKTREKVSQQQSSSIVGVAIAYPLTEQDDGKKIAIAYSLNGRGTKGKLPWLSLLFNLKV